jgi:hypothetical protein
MCPADGFEVVFVDEFVADVLAPAVACASGGGVESAFAVVCGVGPEEVAEGSTVGDVLLAVDVAELI